MITNNGKKYWIYYIKRYGIEKFLDKVYVEFDKLEKDYKYNIDSKNKFIKQQDEAIHL